MGLCLITAVFNTGCQPEKIFDDAQIAKQQKLTSPLSNWLIIEQFDSGHIIRALAPYQWFYKNSANVFLNAKGELRPFTPEYKQAIQGQLGSAYMEKLHTYQIDNLNKDLTKALDRAVAYTDVYILRVFSSYYFSYELFIYANGETVDHIMVCKDYCNETEAEIITVTRSSG